MAKRAHGAHGARAAFPSGLVERVVDELRTHGFVVLVASSGGSKTAMLNRALSELEKEHGYSGRRPFEAAPVHPSQPVTRESFHPVSPDLCLAMERLDEPVSGARELLPIENVHLDPLGFRTFWMKWEKVAEEERPLLVVTTRPHYVENLVAQRLWAKLPLTPTPSRFELGMVALHSAGSAPGFVDLEVHRDNIFDAHAGLAFGDPLLTSPVLRILRRACARNQERLRQLALTKKSAQASDSWTEEGLRKDILTDVFEKEVSLESFGGIDEGQQRRDAFLEICAYRRFEGMAPRPALEVEAWLKDHRDVVRIDGGRCFVAIHPDHAKLLLEAAKASGDRGLPAWVHQRGGFVAPLLRRNDAKAFEMFGGLIQEILNTDVVDNEEFEGIFNYFLATLLPLKEQWDRDLLVATGFVFTRNRLPPGRMPDVAKAAVELANLMPTPASWIFGEVRLNALATLGAPPVQYALDASMRRTAASALAAEVIGLLEGRHTGRQAIHLLAVACWALPFYAADVPLALAGPTADALYALSAGQDDRLQHPSQDDPSAEAYEHLYKKRWTQGDVQVEATRALLEPALAASLSGEPAHRLRELADAYAEQAGDGKADVAFMLRDAAATITRSSTEGLVHEALGVLRRDGPARDAVLNAALRIAGSNLPIEHGDLVGILKACAPELREKYSIPRSERGRATIAHLVRRCPPADLAAAIAELDPEDARTVMVK